MTALRVGSVEWERAGGPPLTLGQRAVTLAGSARAVTGHFVQYAWWRLGRMRAVARIDLEDWRPPDSAAARAAEEACRDVSTPHMVRHCLRTYYFSAACYESQPDRPKIDREVLYVAAMMHDVGLFEEDPTGCAHCFTVTGARRAREVVAPSQWSPQRAARMAMAITSNPQPRVRADTYGVEAHYLNEGGFVEIVGQPWRVHPDNLTEILTRFPREGFADDVVGLVKSEVARHPRGRFACLDPLFAMLLRRARFGVPEPAPP